MDIARPDIPQKKRRRRIILFSVAASGLVIVVIVLAVLGPAAPTVDRAAIWIDTVKRGPMVCEIRGNGALVPEEIRWITATSPGRVERILMLPGVKVTADTVLIELSNPELLQAEIDAESAVKSAQAELEKLQVQLDSERLTEEAKIESLKADLMQAKLEADADESLLKDGLVPELTARRSRAKATALKKQYDLEQKRLDISADSDRSQLTVQNTEVTKLHKQYELKKHQVEAMKIRAGIDGVLQRLGGEQPLQVGQQVEAGASVARVANPEKLKAEIRIVETEAKDVQDGQLAVVDTHNGEIRGHVMRVDPGVQSGTVTIDIALDGPLPRGVRPDLSVDARITLERLDDVLFVTRPVNSQADSKVALFRLSNGGRDAVRVPVQLGKSSVSTIEVKQGLQVGDQVILSDTRQWESHDRLRLN